MLLLAALLLLPTAVSADEPEYTFVLTANGADSCRAAAGDIVTVTLAVRCDSGTDAVYAAQDEIVFDPAFFAFEPDSVLTRSGVKTSTLHLRDGRQAVYMSFISYGSAADWAGETVLGSFRLRVLAEDGTGALCSSNYLVSSQDGMTHFPAGAEDAAVVVSELCRVTFQTNGGGDIPPQMVYRGNALTLPEMPERAGYTFAGWYSDIDLTMPWLETTPVTADMTLYAAWTGAETASAQGTWLPAAAILLLAAALAAGFSASQLLPVRAGEHYTVKGIPFTAVPAYNIGKPFHPRSIGWVGYVAELDGLRVYVSGDTDDTPEARAVSCDAAFLPVGGTYTMTAAEAAALANALHPQIAVATHYGSIVGAMTDGDDFTAQLAPGIRCVKLI